MQHRQSFNEWCASSSQLSSAWRLYNDRQAGQPGWCSRLLKGSRSMSGVNGKVALTWNKWQALHVLSRPASTGLQCQ